MRSTDFPDRACYELFSDYPLAVTSDNHDGTTRSMILMLRENYRTTFFVLSHSYAEGRSSYSLRSWPPEEGADAEEDAPYLPDSAVQVLTRGVPIPRHGSLLGWTGPGRVTALIAIYAKYTPASPEPYWAVMPLADAPQTQWPPFTDEPDFGKWFWKLYKDGKICSLEGLITANPGAVFWADTKAVLASDCCADAHDVKSPEGYILPRGRYVFYDALRAGKVLPPLRTLLTTADRIDLASRFQRYGPSDR